MQWRSSRRSSAARRDGRVPTAPALGCRDGSLSRIAVTITSEASLIWLRTREHECGLSQYLATGVLHTTSSLARA